MALPKAVEEQMRRSEELHRQTYGNTEQPQGNTTPQPAPAPSVEPKSETPPVEPQKPAEAPAKAPDVPNVQPDDEATFKRRYEVLEGKYRAEIPRMAATIRDLTAKLSAAEAKITSVSTPAPSKVRPEEVEEYGEKFIDVVKRAASEVVPDNLGQMQQDVDRLREDTQKLARERFFEGLNREAPHWQRLNEDEGFLTWLSGVDPLTGRTRQELFKEAEVALDSWRIANFFNSYGSAGVQEPAQQRTPEPDPMEQMVEPPTSRVSSPPPGKRVWRVADIQDFYTGVKNRQYTMEDVARIEADIFAAQREGRIAQR